MNAGSSWVPGLETPVQKDTACRCGSLQDEEYYQEKGLWETRGKTETKGERTEEKPVEGQTLSEQPQ